MENDSVYQRININSVVALIRERNPEMEESDARALAYKTVSELGKSIIDIVHEFERGDGLFDACYFSAKDSL